MSIALKPVGRFLLDALKAYGLYLLIVVVGTGVLMYAANSVGYSTYSDRPGTGWFGFHPNLSIENAEFLGSFVLFTALMSALMLYIPALMLITVGIRRFNAPRWLIVMILTPLFALATFWLFAAAGWYIAIDEVFAFVGATFTIPFCIAVSSGNGLAIGRFRIRAF